MYLIIIPYMSVSSTSPSLPPLHAKYSEPWIENLHKNMPTYSHVLVRDTEILIILLADYSDRSRRRDIEILECLSFHENASKHAYYEQQYSFFSKRKTVHVHVNMVSLIQIVIHPFAGSRS